MPVGAFWPRHAARSAAARIHAALQPGDMVLVGARPGHGKTLLGLELAAAAVRNGQHGAVYSLEYTETEIAERLAALGAGPLVGDGRLTLDTSDDICADYIIRQLEAGPRGAVVVIDYLQILDQNREKPELAAQVAALKSFAEGADARFVLISQIDRSYDPHRKPLPDLSDIRLHNPLDPGLFTKTVFVTDGVAHLQAVA